MLANLEDGAIKRATGWFWGVGSVAAVEQRSRTGETAPEGDGGEEGGERGGSLSRPGNRLKMEQNPTGTSPKRLLCYQLELQILTPPYQSNWHKQSVWRTSVTTLANQSDQHKPKMEYHCLCPVTN